MFSHSKWINTAMPGQVTFEGQHHQHPSMLPWSNPLLPQSQLVDFTLAGDTVTPQGTPKNTTEHHEMLPVILPCFRRILHMYENGDILLDMYDNLCMFLGIACGWVVGFEMSLYNSRKEQDQSREGHEHTFRIMYICMGKMWVYINSVGVNVLTFDLYAFPE